MHLVFMGVAGCGKTTAAQQMADFLKWPAAEADDFHPQANIDKMSAGTPLAVAAFDTRLDERSRQKWPINDRHLLRVETQLS